MNVRRYSVLIFCDFADQKTFSVIEDGVVSLICDISLSYLSVDTAQWFVNYLSGRTQCVGLKSKSPLLIRVQLWDRFILNIYTKCLWSRCYSCK